MPPLTEELPTADFYTHNHACGVNTRMVRVTATLHRHVTTAPYSAPHGHKASTPPDAKRQTSATQDEKVRLIGNSHAYDFINVRFRTFSPEYIPKRDCRKAHVHKMNRQIHTDNFLLTFADARHSTIHTDNFLLTLHTICPYAHDSHSGIVYEYTIQLTMCDPATHSGGRTEPNAFLYSLGRV